MLRTLRPKRSLHYSITLSALLMSLNVVLMVCWIVLLAQVNSWSALTIGTVLFSLILVGLVVYLVLYVKEIRLSQRQANFIDSVTHELKSPIASLKLFLETLVLRDVDDAQRKKFYDMMTADLRRLDNLITQMLEVGRLDAVATTASSEEIEIEPLLKHCVESNSMQHQRPVEQVEFEVQPAVVKGSRMALEMIFNNLIDNAMKYSNGDPKIEIQVQVRKSGRVVTRIADHGFGVPPEIRKKVFHMFFRGGNELERTRKGTGLGLYIVNTLVKKMKGTVNVFGRGDKASGAVFVVDLPGRAAPCES